MSTSFRVTLGNPVVSFSDLVGEIPLGIFLINGFNDVPQDSQSLGYFVMIYNYTIQHFFYYPRSQVNTGLFIEIM